MTLPPPQKNDPLATSMAAVSLMPPLFALFAVGLLILDILAIGGGFALLAYGSGSIFPPIGFVLTILGLAGLLLMGPLFVIVACLQGVSVLAGATALARTRSAAAPARGRLLIRVVTIVALLLSFTFLGGFALVAYDVHLGRISTHRKLDMDALPHLAQAVFEPALRPGRRFAPSLAAAAINSPDTLGVEGYLAPSLSMPPTIIPPTAALADAPLYAAAVDDASEFRYVGGDLTDTPRLAPLASRIIILYSKHPYGGGRMVAFADRSVRFVPSADLHRLFAQSSTYRVYLRLPPITLDGPAPPPP